MAVFVFECRLEPSRERAVIPTEEAVSASLAFFRTCTPLEGRAYCAERVRQRVTEGEACGWTTESRVALRLALENLHHYIREVERAC